jgi:hypothetical protein
MCFGDDDDDDDDDVDLGRLWVDDDDVYYPKTLGGGALFYWIDIRA